MRLYHQPRSRSVRALWALTEAGAEYDLQLISREDKQAPLVPGPAPARKVARGRVRRRPAVRVGGHHLGRSATSIRRPDWRPRSAAMRVRQQYQWSFFAASEIEPPLNEIARQLWGDGRAGRGPRSPPPANGSPSRPPSWRPRWKANEFLVGDRFSVADLIVGAVTGLREDGRAGRPAAGGRRVRGAAGGAAGADRRPSPAGLEASEGRPSARLPTGAPIARNVRPSGPASTRRVELGSTLRYVPGPERRAPRRRR